MEVVLEGLMGEASHEVVGFLPGDGDCGEVEGLEDLMDVGDGMGDGFGLGLAMLFVWGEGLVAPGGLGTVEGGDDVCGF